MKRDHTIRLRHNKMVQRLNYDLGVKSAIVIDFEVDQFGALNLETLFQVCK